MPARERCPVAVSSAEQSVTQTVTASESELNRALLSMDLQLSSLGEVIAPRSMVYLALSYDHRLVDGADAARFLGTIKERLEGGNFEAEVGL